MLVVSFETVVLQLDPTSNLCNFNLAVNESVRDKTGTIQNSPTWFRVAVWGKRAYLCAQTLKKGSAVYVSGRLKPKQWQDKEGEQHFSLEVKASDIRFFGLPDSQSVKVA